MSKINEKIRNHVLSSKEYQEFYGEKNISEDEEIIEFILESDVIWEGDYDRRRHWTNCFCVCKIGEMFIGYESATGGDVHDKGWEFNPETFCEMEESEQVVKIYKLKKT